MKVTPSLFTLNEQCTQNAARITNIDSFNGQPFLKNRLMSSQTNKLHQSSEE